MKMMKITETDDGYFIESEFFFGSDFIREAKFVSKPNHDLRATIDALLQSVQMDAN